MNRPDHYREAERLVDAAVSIPDKAVNAGWHEFRYPRPAVDEPSEAFLRGLRGAAPLIVAEDYEKFAAELLRVVLHSLPEYTHGSVGQLIMNEIDNRVDELRGFSHSSFDLYRDNDGDVWRGNDLMVSLVSVQDSVNHPAVGDAHYTNVSFSRARAEFGLEKIES
jgi:hypothetical protein